MIPLATALRDSAITVKGNQPHLFSIEFVLKSGELRKIKKATRFMKTVKEVMNGKKTDKIFYNLKENSLILVRDTENPNKHPYPVNIHLITKYNDIIVKH